MCRPGHVRIACSGRRSRPYGVQWRRVTADLAESLTPPTNAPEPPPEPQHPHPPRYRRLKRYAVVTLLFFAAVLAARLWWGHESARRLATEVDAIRARGGPAPP